MLSPVPQPDLAATLWGLVDTIPAGNVVSYGDLAAAMGDVKTARWVATELLHHESRGPACPCFRVVRKTGEVASFAHGTTDDKAEQLREDGVHVADGVVTSGRWTVSAPPYQPFQEMKLWQRDLAAASVPTIQMLPDEIAALDVSYLNDGRAVVACVVINRHVGFDEPATVLWQHCEVVEPKVPYVTGYLVFRELPALLAAYHAAEDAGMWPGLAVIDGSGRLHPRRAGVATCFANLTGQPTIGVTKKRLLGSYDESKLSPGTCQPVLAEGQQVGTAMRSRTGGKPVFVSPGEGIDQADADRIIAPTLTIHRVPEPIYWADRISRDYAARLM